MVTRGSSARHIVLRSWILSTAVFGGVTAIMVPVRTRISDTIVALVYLLVVLLTGARGGRAIALTISGVAFLSFNWFFMPPYGTLVLADPSQWLVLLAFLAVSVVATQLFEQSRREAVLNESLRAKDAVMASLSHDLRAPLTSIKALAHDIATTGDARARVIEEETNRLHDMVGDVLDLSRLNTGAMHMSIDVNDAEDVVGAALRRIASLWPDREINVKIDDPEALRFGRFDFASTLRVLVNLIDNALKYSASYDPVDLEVARDGPWLSFRVMDLGDGIPAGERERIFEPFYRPNGMAPDVHGAGLGLSIARALTEAQGGSLTYEPRRGGGSVFVLAVPAADYQTATP